MDIGDKKVIFVSEDSTVEHLLIGVLSLKQIPFTRAVSEPEALRRLSRRKRVLLVCGLPHAGWIARLKRRNPDILAIGLCTEQDHPFFTASNLDYCLRPFDFDFLFHLLERLQVSRI